MDFPPFAAVIKDITAEHRVCKADFAHAMEALPMLREKWMYKQTTKALKMRSRKNADGNVIMKNHDELFIAITLFNCRQCREPIEFARFIHHSHKAYKWEYETRWDTLHQYSQELIFSQATSENANRIIIKSGSNPAVATVKEMDDSGAWFRCQLVMLEKTDLLK
jgi:hypothetical protein